LAYAIEVVSGGGEARGRYPEAELKRCIAMSFSAGELSQFAAQLGVLLDREGRIEEGARTLVRALSMRGELDRLLSRLREAKPLVQWPEPQAPEPAAAPFVPAAPLPGLGSPGSLGGPEPMPPPEPAGERKPASDGSPAAPASGEPLLDPFAADEAEQAAVRRRSMRGWLALGAVFAAGIGIGAVIISLMLREDEPAGGEPAAMAAVAADHLRSAVSTVAKACEAEPNDSARGQLADAFRRCSGPRIRPGLDTTPLLPPPAPDPRAPAHPRAQPGAPVSREPACLDTCHRMHASCKESECGAEPRSAEKYADYQRCLGECLAKYSRCRLGCR
jgi:hypothetical protein